jgi:hypothetical protein
MHDIQFPMFRIEVEVDEQVIYSVTKFTRHQADERYNLLKEEYTGHDATIRIVQVTIIKQEKID